MAVQENQLEAALETALETAAQARENSHKAEEGHSQLNNAAKAP